VILTRGDSSQIFDFETLPFLRMTAARLGGDGVSSGPQERREAAFRQAGNKREREL
jgi:hypothetical protein